MKLKDFWINYVNFSSFNLLFPELTFTKENLKLPNSKKTVSITEKILICTLYFKNIVIRISNQFLKPIWMSYELFVLATNQIILWEDVYGPFTWVQIRWRRGECNPLSFSMLITCKNFVNLMKLWSVNVKDKASFIKFLQWFSSVR